MTARFSSPLPLRSVVIRRLFVALSAIAYAVILEHTYTSIVSPRYAYYGMRSIDLNYTQYAFMILMVGVCSLFLSVRELRPSSMLKFGLYVNVIIPLSFVCFHLSSRSGYGALELPLAVAANFAVLCLLMDRQRPFVVPAIPLGPVLAMTALVGVALLTMAMRIYFYDTWEIDFNLYNVYERRLASRGVFEQRSLQAYLIKIGTSAVGLAMIVIGAVRRQYVLWLIGITLYLIAFITIGSKAALFLPVVIMGSVVLLKRFGARAQVIMLLALGLFSVLAILEEEYSDTFVLSGMFVRRQMVVPGAITVGYFDFFSENSKYYWSDSVLRWFVDSPYSVSKSFLIGYVSTGRPETNANANIWASGFADAGYLGMFIATVLASFVGRALDGTSIKLGLGIPSLAAIAVSFQFSQSPIERCLVGHGVLALLVFLYMLQPAVAHRFARVPVNRKQDESTGPDAGKGSALRNRRQMNR